MEPHMHLTIKDTPAASFQAAGCAGCRHAANLEIPWFQGDISSQKFSREILDMYIYIYIWVNYNISLTWIKAIWGWFPFLTMIPVRSQWGRYNLPSYICIYIIHPFLPAVFSLSLVFSSDSEQTLASSPSLTWPLAWRWRHPDFWIVSFLHWIPAFPMFGQIPMKKPCRFLFLLIS